MTAPRSGIDIPTDSAAGRKVGGTVGIVRYGLVAGSVPKMFKIIPICSAHVATIVGWFQKRCYKSKNPTPCWRRHSIGGWNFEAV